MKMYTVIDKDERNAVLELMLYTFEELKEGFKPEYDPDYSKESYLADLAEWEEISDISDLEHYLNDREMNHYEFKTEEVESLEAAKRRNEWWSSDERLESEWD